MGLLLRSLLLPNHSWVAGLWYRYSLGEAEKWPKPQVSCGKIRRAPDFPGGDWRKLHLQVLNTHRDLPKIEDTELHSSKMVVWNPHLKGPSCCLPGH